VTSGGTTYGGGDGGSTFTKSGTIGRTGGTAVGTPSVVLSGWPFPGAGAGGSGGRNGTACVNGGDGGLYGGGGGGGGGNAGQDSGSGGNGAHGIVVVICR